MKHISVLLVAAVLLLGCKKAKENIVAELASSFLDGTEWKVVAFSDGTNNLDAAFQPYQFRFNKNGTVDAIRNNNKDATGTWKADVFSRTIQANYNAAAVHPLPLLSTTWHITENTLTSLSATATVGSTVRKLRMEKL